MSLDTFSLKNRTALITGASSGIGYGLALGLAKAGAHVVVAARRASRLEALVERVESEGGKATAVAMDVTNQSSIENAFVEGEKTFGTIDIVVNNAGISGDIKPFFEAADDNFDVVINTNLKGVWNVAKEGARRMVEAKKAGSIINIASVMGIRAEQGHAPYCASKAAVIHLTRALALDFARFGIRVNCIAPGYFVTEINEDYLLSEPGKAYLKKTAMRRAGNIDELVGPTVMLASDAGSFVNGTVIPVDGAHHVQLV